MAPRARLPAALARNAALCVLAGVVGCALPVADGAEATREPTPRPPLAASVSDPDVTRRASLGDVHSDADGDGFLDGEDHCPGEPGIAPNGCPLRDSDGDGLLDPDDARCPNACETYNGYADADGCPDELPADLQAATGRIKDLKFDFSKDTIRPSSYASLRAIADTLLRYPDVRVEIQGHDDSGNRSAVYSRLRLSLRRADSVRAFLIDHGVAAERIQAEGYGEERPIDTNKTAEGRANNRRVEVHVLVKAPEGAESRCAG